MPSPPERRPVADPVLDDADVDVSAVPPPAAPRPWPPTVPSPAPGAAGRASRRLAFALGRASALLVAAGATASLLLLSPVGTRRLARETAEREIRSMLAPTERERYRAFATQRRPADLWRRSHGLLVATDQRLLYVGMAPLPLLRPQDPGPRDLYLESWPYEQAFDVRVEQGREAVQLRVRSPGREMRYGLDTPTDAEALRAAAEAARMARRAEVERLLEVDRPRPRVERYVTHVVQRGETLSALAVRYGTTVPVLRQLNGLQQDGVRAGQRLRVPEPPPPVDTLAPG